MSPGPLDRARQDLLDAKAAADAKDTPANRTRVEEAMAHLDYLLETLPIPRTPGGPVAHRPGPPVSSTPEGECQRGPQSSEGER